MEFGGWQFSIQYYVPRLGTGLPQCGNYSLADRFHSTARQFAQVRLQQILLQTVLRTVASRWGE